jgi:hypothetical protein
MLRPVALMVGLLTASVASAHPMSRVDYSMRTAIQLDGDRLEAVVVMEVPFDVVAADLRAGMEAARSANDPSHQAQQVLDAYSHKVWDQLGQGLRVRVNGQVVPGSWGPKENRLNGKGAVTGGFFLYMVEFKPAAPLQLGPGVDVVVENWGMADKPMVYSAMVVAGRGWTVTMDSSRVALPNAPYNVDDPRFWTRNLSLRRLEARFVAAP